MKSKSWRTTALGVFTILAAISAAGIALLDGDPETLFNIPILIAQLTAGAGLIMARDQNVTSKSLGLTK